MKKKFLQGALISFTIIIGVVFTINFIVKPLSLSKENLYNTQGIPTNFFYTHSPIDSIYKILYKGKDISTTVIGTSNVHFGILDCNYIDIQRISFPGMFFEEEVYLTHKVLKNSVESKKILLEITSTKKYNKRKGINRLRDFKPSFLDNFLSMKTTKKSIIKLLNKNIDSSKTTCQLKIFSTLEKQKERNVLAEIELNNLKKGKKNNIIRPFLPYELEEIKNGLLTISTSYSEVHDIVLFFSPIYKEVLSLESFSKTYIDNKKQIEKIIKIANLRSNGPRFYLVDCNYFDNEYTYSIKTPNLQDGWYDLTHYKPIIGKQVLENALDQIKKRKVEINLLNY